MSQSQTIIQRLCNKSRELALEKRKNTNLFDENKKLKIIISELKINNDSLNKENIVIKRNDYTNLLQKNTCLKMDLDDALKEILMLKQILCDANASTTQTWDYPVMEISDDENNADFCQVIGSQDSARSEEPPVTKEDIDMIDNTFDESESEGSLYKPKNVSEEIFSSDENENESDDEELESEELPLNEDNADFYLC